jgi:catechol 2,3-dioxygenase-like lactoylglutathione lyase family enzyme
VKTIVIGLLAALLAGSALAEPPPKALTPTTISSGWNVIDLEAMRAWYIDKLGMKVTATYNRDGRVFEYVMGYEGAPAGASVLALLVSPQRKPGPNTASRLILRVPDSKALSEHLAKQGVTSRLVAPGAYFITDPEGNAVELYTPPPPAK